MVIEPRLSVVLPVYNALPYLQETLDSLSSQSFTRFEVIAIDDGSTDGSSQLLREHAEQDRRFRVARQDNRGGAAARNRAVAMARSDLLALVDADDVLLPDRFALQVHRFEQDPALSVLGGAADVIDEDGTIIDHDVMPTGHDAIVQRLLSVGSCLYDPTVMLRRDAFLVAGGYREWLRVAYDYDLWLRMLPRRFGNLPDTLVRYRVHGAQASADAARVIFTETALRAAASCRRRGRPDPLDDWRGEFDLERIASLELGAVDEIVLWARLLEAAGSSARRADDPLEESVMGLVQERFHLLGSVTTAGLEPDWAVAVRRLPRRLWKAGRRVSAAELAVRMAISDAKMQIRHVAGRFAARTRASGTR